MPWKLNVGLSKKVGESNYGSRGASLNIDLEVEASLASEPAKLQERIRQLFGLVRASLDAELNDGRDQANSRSDVGGPLNTGQPNGTNSDGRSPDRGQRTYSPRLATQSQVKALYAITRSQRLNLNQILRERFAERKAEELTIQEASQLIDHLKNSPDRGGN